MTESPDDFKEQSLTEHLTELRVVLIRAVWILMLGFGVCYSFSDKIFDFLREPITPYLGESGGLHFLSVQEKFMAHIKVSFLAGVMLTSPLWLFQVWLFIAPGLYVKEKRYLVSFIFFGAGLFTLGVSFVHYFVLPRAFDFLIHFAGDTDKAMITISAYLDFIVKFYLAFGITFELPLVMTFLGMMGLVNAKLLRHFRRWAILLMAVISAVITPPDALSMIALLVPMILLYEISILLVQAVAPKVYEG